MLHSRTCNYVDIKIWDAITPLSPIVNGGFVEDMVWVNDAITYPCKHGWIDNEKLQWRHNGRDGVSNHLLHHCLLNRLFGRRSKQTSKLRVTGLCAVNSPGTGEFPTQVASNAKHASIWWRHHESLPFHVLLEQPRDQSHQPRPEPAKQPQTLTKLTALFAPMTVWHLLDYLDTENNTSHIQWTCIKIHSIQIYNDRFRLSHAELF